MSGPTSGTPNTSGNSAGGARGVHVPGGDTTRRTSKRQQRVTPVPGAIPARAYPLPSDRHKPASKPHTTNTRRGRVSKRG